MLADAHRQAAEGIERTIADVGDVATKPYAVRSVIELYWGAAFHWIAYGTQGKHGKHKENHTKLARYLSDVGEPVIGGLWWPLEYSGEQTWWWNVWSSNCSHRRRRSPSTLAGDSYVGNQLDEIASQHDTIQAPRGLGLQPQSVPDWLDQDTASLVSAITADLYKQSEVQSVILFGSVARHEERPLSDSEPSDVDLLVLVDPGPRFDRLPLDREVEMHIAIGGITHGYRNAPREVQVIFAQGEMADWDPLFVENVARDGILLWARGPLPVALAAVEERATASAS